jgi:pimeloyl-ACP methyl ester carboxylesterase
MTVAMPPAQFADFGSIRIAYYEAGIRTARPSLILCHGFPETAYSWRHQIHAFAEDGWHVITMDQRGYGLSSIPAEVTAYDAEALCGDYEALLDHLGIGQAVFVGHDWGGAMVWQMAMRRPHRVAGVLSLNTPFQKRAPIDPIQIMRDRMGPEMYIVHFQAPGDADAILADTRRALGYFFRRPPTGYAGSRGYGEKRTKDGPSIFPLARELAEYVPEADGRQRFLTDEEFDTFVEAFDRTGFTGGINWYRNITRNWETAAAYDHLIARPSLMVMAEFDPWLPPSSADGMEAIVPDLEKVLIRDCGHWSQQERPDEVNRIALEWLNRRFGDGSGELGGQL